MKKSNKKIQLKKSPVKKYILGGGVPGYVDSSAGTYFNGYDADELVSISDDELNNPVNGYSDPMNAPGAGGMGMLQSLTGITDPLGKIIGGIGQLGEERKQLKRARQSEALSSVVLKASGTRAEKPERNYIRPEDNVNSGSAFFPIYGVGTNVLAKDGAKIPSYNNGGSLFGNFLGNTKFGDFMSSGGGQVATGLANYATGNNAGGVIGSAIGETAGGLLGGQSGKMLGSVLGTLTGGFLDRNPSKIKKAQAAAENNMMAASLNQAAPGLQAGYASHLRNGGEISSLERRGELTTHWGGDAELMSYNPYLPGEGETVMFKGQSHDSSDGNGNSGIGVTFGNNPVEVEGGEPALKLVDENGPNLTVFGNLKIDKEYATLLGDKKAQGKKFKNYIAELSKDEAKQNKLVDRSINEVDEMPVITSFDKLKMTSMRANILGANMKLKDLADKKMNAASLQDAIHEISDKTKVAPENIKKAKYGMTIAADGDKTPYTSKYGLSPWEGNKTGLGNKTASEFTAREWDAVAEKYGFKGQGNEEFQKFLINHPEASKIIKARHKALYGKDPFIDGKLGFGYAAPDLLNVPQAASIPAATDVQSIVPGDDKTFETVKYKRNPLVDIYNTALPYLRPTDQENLDPRQLLGEMYALSTNQLEPVDSQSYVPEIGVPYDISLQDQMNANQSDYRSMQRLAGYNPASQAILNANKYEANSKILGEQFRMNQGMKDAVYRENRNVLNDAKLKNLSLRDQQYVRQAQAMANTKATNQAVLNSISDKYAKNRLENKTLGIYENLYNYRYDSSGRAINMNPLFQPNMPTVYNEGDVPAGYKMVTDKSGKIIGYEPSKPIEVIQDEDEYNFQPIVSEAPTDLIELTKREAYNQVDPKRMGGKIRRNYGQSSIVKNFK